MRDLNRRQIAGFDPSTEGRFLREWLVDARVAEQYQLVQDIFQHEPLFNPRQRRAPPTPRPDCVMSRASKVGAIADAKYRDLWERDLPAGMLYQLSLCALTEAGWGAATILYPSPNATARESRIAINDPVTEIRCAQVALQPVNLAQFSELVASAHGRE